MNQYYSLSILTSILLLQTASIQPAQAKQSITVTQRQDMLMKEINKAEKSGELTAKEAKSLRDSETKIIEQESKMKDNNAGKLSYKDINKVEKELNKISNKMHEKELAKRVLK